MTVVRSYIDSFDKAIAAALAKAQVGDLRPEIVRLFNSMLDDKSSQQEVERLVANAVKGHYGKNVSWDIQDWWQVPVPSPRYEASGLPSLVIETRVFVVASVEISPQSSHRSWHIAVVELLGKPQMVVLPLFFIQALLDGNEDGYRIVGKDGPWTVREIAGLRQPLRLHDELVERLRNTLKLKPVADFLCGFGPRGVKLVPLVVGALLGLMYRSTGASLPIEQLPWSRETLIEVVTGLGYSAARAQRVVQLAEPEFKIDMTLEEAIRIVLKYIGKEA